jgi:glutathione S-transferase
VELVHDRWSQNNFGNWSRKLYNTCLPIFSRYGLKDDVREAMYDEVKVFLKALGKRYFLGGKQPNLADLVMHYIYYI